MQSFIALPPRQRAARLSGRRVSRDSVTLDAPVRTSRNVFCVGRNYLEHAREGARATGKELKLPDTPTFFAKASGSIAAPGSVIHFQADVSREYDYEAELAIVIGMRCKNVEESAWRDVVFGYTCLNDLTARDVQRAHGQWFKGKSLDESCPIGPVVVSADELPDPQRLQIRLRRNGVEKQRASTESMIFPVSRLVSVLSSGMTLEPGDLLATGTPEGVGFARTPPEFLRDGDELEVEIDGIGLLRNRIEIA